MATVKEIYDFIDIIAPFNTQEEWDNSGLLVGNKAQNVNKILFALDITSDIVNQAIDCGADLIVTHHPLIFKPLSTVLSDTITYKLIESGISLICAHTNYDKAVDGVNDILCKTVGLNNFSKVDGTCLSIAEFDNSTSANGFINTVKTALGGVIRFNSVKNDIKKIAICSGSGSDYLETAKELNCDALLTGDASHHAFLDADEMNILLIAAGHFETENISIEPLLEKIKHKFSLDCVLASQNTPIMAI